MRSNRWAGILGAVVALLLLVGLAWAFRAPLMERWGRQVEYTEVSPEAAAAAERKLERLRSHGETVRLSEVEVASLLRFRLADQYPDLLQNPSAAMAGDTLRIGARVSSDRLPDLRELERIRAFLPDTTRIDLEGRLLSREPGRVAVEIDEVAVAGIPIPQRYYPSVLERLGRRGDAGLPPNAMEFALPQGVGSARVEGGYLVLSP